MINYTYPAMIALLFLLGASLASFLNVVVLRIPQMRKRMTWQGRRVTLSHPPSRCMSCETTLKWYDNIPVLGWLKLKGKCRSCGMPFSFLYAGYELAGGIVFITPLVTIGLSTYSVILGGAGLVVLYVPAFWRSVRSCRSFEG